MNIKKSIRLFTLFTLLLIIVSFVACGGDKGEKVSTGTFEKMHSSMKIFAYVSPKNIQNVELFSKIWEEQMDESDNKEIDEILKSVDNIYVGMEKINADEMNDFEKVAKTTHYTAMMRGTFDKENLKKMAKEKSDGVEEVKFGEIDALKNDEMTVLFMDESTIIATSPGFENAVIDAYVNGKDTVDKNSPEYKEMKQMKSNLMWAVADLTEMGKFNLAEKTLGMVQGETAFGITKMGITGENGTIVFDVSSNLDSAEVSKGIAESINGVIQMGKALLVGQLGQLGITGQAKSDIEKIIDETKLVAEDKKLKTQIKIKESTVEELQEQLAPLLGSMIGGF